MQNRCTQGKFSSQIYGFFTWQHYSGIQETTEKKLVDVCAADSLQMWRGNSPSLKAGESWPSFPNKSKEASHEQGRGGLKILDETDQICPGRHLCGSLVEPDLLQLPFLILE